MPQRDLHNNIKVSPGLNPQAISSSTTTVGATIDSAGYASLEFLIQSATLTDGTYTPAIYGGDASDMSDEVALTAAELLGTIAGATFAATDDNKTKKLGVGACNKRYYRLKLVSTSVTSGGTLAAQAVQGHPRHAPVS